MGDVVPLGLSARAALRIIHHAAEDTWRISWTGHASKRMRERRIAPTQVLRCLRSGKLVDGPHRDEYGKWICRLEKLTAGDPPAVVVAIEPPSNIIVRSTFEPD